MKLYIFKPKYGYLTKNRAIIYLYFCSISVFYLQFFHPEQASYGDNRQPHHFGQCNHLH